MLPSCRLSRLVDCWGAFGRNPRNNGLRLRCRRRTRFARCDRQRRQPALTLRSIILQLCDQTRCRRIRLPTMSCRLTPVFRVDTTAAATTDSLGGSPATVASGSFFSGCATRRGAVESRARQEPSTDTGLRTTVWRHNAAAAATDRRSGCTAPVAASGSLFATAALRPVGGILSVASCRHSPTPKVA